MASTATDGWIVVQHGKVVAEHYYGGMVPDTSHLLMSVSKSLIGMVAGALFATARSTWTRSSPATFPALAHSGYAGATVRHVLDMRSGIKFSEDYLDPLAEVRLIEQAIGWAPRTVPDLPTTMYDFLLTLRQESAHGGPFQYRSCETDVLGWVCESAAGVRMPELMSELLWSRIGAQNDAVIGIDAVGTGMFDGGINACLRDLVRFGSLFLTGGVADRTAGGAPGVDRRHVRRRRRLPGGVRRQPRRQPHARRHVPQPVLVAVSGDNVLVCLGIHGQMIYVNRAANLVAAKLSSWPLPQDATKLFPTISAFDEIAVHLS